MTHRTLNRQARYLLDRACGRTTGPGPLRRGSVQEWQVGHLSQMVHVCTFVAHARHLWWSHDPEKEWLANRSRSSRATSRQHGAQRWQCLQMLRSSLQSLQYVLTQKNSSLNEWGLSIGVRPSGCELPRAGCRWKHRTNPDAVSRHRPVRASRRRRGPRGCSRRNRRSHRPPRIHGTLRGRPTHPQRPRAHHRRPGPVAAGGVGLGRRVLWPHTRGHRRDRPRCPQLRVRDSRSHVRERGDHRWHATAPESSRCG